MKSKIPARRRRVLAEIADRRAFNAAPSTPRNSARAHRAQDLTNNETFTLRTAGHYVHAACTVILEKRGVA